MCSVLLSSVVPPPRSLGTGSLADLLVTRHLHVSLTGVGGFIPQCSSSSTRFVVCGPLRTLADLIFTRLLPSRCQPLLRLYSRLGQPLRKSSLFELLSDISTASWIVFTSTTTRIHLDSSSVPNAIFINNVSSCQHSSAVGKSVHVHLIVPSSSR